MEQRNALESLKLRDFNMAIQVVDRTGGGSGDAGGEVTIINADPIPVEFAAPPEIIVDFPPVQEVEFATPQQVTIENPAPIDVNITFPSNQDVTVTNVAAIDVEVTNFPATQSVTFPSAQNVNVANAAPIPVTTTFPTTQQVAFASPPSVNSTPIIVSSNSNSFYRSSALESKAIVKASTGILMQCAGFFDSIADSGTYYLQFYNSAAVPVDGAVSILTVVKINHTSGYDDEIFFSFDLGMAASNGISFALSSTQFTKTEVLGQDYLALTIGYR